MEDFAALLNGLHGFSLMLGLGLGLLGGFVFAMLTYRFYGRRFRESFEQVSDEMKGAFNSLSATALQNNQQSFLTLANDKFADQSQRHSLELEAKEQNIDTRLQHMKETLDTVPAELEKNQQTVSTVIEKSAKTLEESNKVHLNQLQQKSDSQSKEHFSKLDEKETQINRRLGEMDAKLGKVEALIAEFEKARESKLGALDDQLKNLTATTSSLQKALADNRARGQWGERMAEDMLKFMGLVEGVHYTKQSALEAGTRPDFTFLFPNQKSLNMDAKFPLDNYLRYIEAESEPERKEYSQRFLRDVSQRVSEIQKRGYIAAGTLDCVLIFIPNEQVYRFIYEEDQSLIDKALRQKVVMCSPLTLYIVLAVIHQAAQNFNIERRSQEIVEVVNDIRKEWEKYTGQMDKLERRFKGMNDDFRVLTGTRSRQLDRKFDKIEAFSSNDALLPLADDDVLEP